MKILRDKLFINAEDKLFIKAKLKYIRKNLRS
jgi:hypothetical protein